MILLISLNQQDEEILKKAPTDISAFGVRHISAYLKSKNESCKILFLSKKHGEEETAGELAEIEKFVHRLKPDLIGVSLMSNHYLRAKKITEDIRRYYKNPIVWGGIHPTIKPIECLEHADIVFVGEAEHSFLDFYKEFKGGIKNYKTKGIVYKNENGEVVNNGVYPLEHYLDKFPFQDYDLEDHFVVLDGALVQMDKNVLSNFLPFSQKHYRVMTTRGCPFNCAYCGSAFLKNMYEGRFLRGRSVDNVLDEIKAVLTLLSGAEINFIKIMDDCFTINTVQWLSEFAKKYKERINLPFFCLVSPATITQEKLSILMDAGLKSVQIGLQSGSDRTNKDIYSRRISRDQFLNSFTILDKFRTRLKFNLDVITDNPFETEDDRAETARLLNEIKRPFNLILYSLTFYPGTVLYNRAVSEGVLSKNPDEYITKQFHKIKNDYFNKLMRLIPVLNSEKINSFIENRKKILTRLKLNLYYFIFSHKNIVPGFLKNLFKLFLRGF